MHSLSSSATSTQWKPEYCLKKLNHSLPLFIESFLTNCWRLILQVTGDRGELSTQRSNIGLYSMSSHFQPLL